MYICIIIYSTVIYLTICILSINFNQSKVSDIKLSQPNKFKASSHTLFSIGATLSISKPIWQIV